MPDPNDPNAFPPTNPFGAPEGQAHEDPSHGNRPASGARQVSPGEVFSQGFDGADNAGDFLGLDTGFDPSQQASDPNFAMPTADLTLQDEVVDEEDVDAEDYVYDEENEYEDYDEEAPDEEEFDEAIGEMVDEFDEGSTERKSPLVTVFLFMILLGGGGYAGYLYGPGLYEKHLKQHVDGFLGTQQVAQGPSVPRPVPSTGTQTNTPATAQGGEASTEVEPVADPGPSGPAPTEVASADPVVESNGGEVEPPVESFTPDVIPQEPIAPSEPIASGNGAPTMFDGLKNLFGEGTEAQEEPVSFGSTTSAEPFDISDLPTESAWANRGDLDIIWRGTDVPMDALDSPTRVMTPRVGFVRAHLDAGSVFDGRLFAIGQNRVWIDAEPGRIGLDGSRITSIERMPEVVANANFDLEGIGSGDQVRVRVPGGALYGRVLKVDGEHVTLTTGSGRITLLNPEIEPVGSSRAIIVGR